MQIIFVRSLHLAVILLICNCHVSGLSLFKKSSLLRYCRCVFVYVILTKFFSTVDDLEKKSSHVGSTAGMDTFHNCT